MEPKDRILKGAEELFFKYGIKSITMDDIAKHLAISKKTIYQFFEDKNELLETLMKQRLELNICEMDQITKDAENVITETLQLMKHMGAIFAQMNPNVFYDMQKYHPTAWKIFKQFKEVKLAKVVENSITRGVKEGLVRSDINPKIMARLRLEEVEMGFNPQIFPPDKFKITDVQVALLDHFLLGICTIKGHKLMNKYKELIEEE